MVKLLLAEVLLLSSVKKVVETPSGRAFTWMVTPLVGKVLPIVTVNGNVGPGAAASLAPLAGLVVTVNVFSVLQLSDVPPFFPQNGIDTASVASARQVKSNFFML